LAKRLLPFLAFTAAFAALAAYVFWGCWSLDVSPVMPDDVISHSMLYGDIVDKALREFWTSGKFIPTDILWKGLLFSPYFCQELKYCVALYASGLALAWFLRGRGLSPLASYGGGLLLAFCGYWSSLFSAGHGGWFVWMTFGVFAFGLIDRMDKPLLLGAVLAWGSFYQPDLWLLFTAFTGLYLVWRCIRERCFPWKTLLLAAAAFFAIGAVSFRSALVNDLAGRDAQIAEGQTLSKAAKDAAKGDDAEREKRWIFVTNWSLPTDETAEFFIPRLNGDTSCPLTLSIGAAHGTGVKPYTGAIGRPIDAKQGNYRQHSIYVGWITCLLALVGLVAFRKHRDVAFFAGAVLLFWLCSLGRYCEPVYRVIFSLPFGDYLRAPVKWHHLTEFCLVILAAYGIHTLEGFLKKFNRPHLLLAPYSLLLLVLLAAFDLARVDRYYCAPVNLKTARARNCDMQFSIMRRQDFANPQIAEAARQGYIVSLANYMGHPDYFLVGNLKPRKAGGDHRAPLPPMSAQTGLGFLSVLSSLGVIGYSLFAAKRRTR